MVVLGALAGGLLLARFLTAVIDQSGERRLLIERLRAAQARLAEAERLAGALAERQRLAGELHDTVTQDLASIAMQLEVAETLIGRDPERAARHLAIARRSARDALAEARRLALSPAPDTTGPPVAGVGAGG
jgi:signal transduction histidine kinase